jgi:hypothetical protein
VKKKVLTVCNGGNVRSTMLAEVLKGTFGCDAINIGTYWASHETIGMLASWADLIVPVEPRFTAKLPEPDLRYWIDSPIWNWPEKIRIAKIGPDAWGHEKWKELKETCVIAAQEILHG